MTLTEHASLHAIEDRGFKLELRICPACGGSFECNARSSLVYCKASCASHSRQKFDLSREDLYLLVWTLPTTKVALILGVSDVAVAKRCKKLNIPKPSRGYWAKVQSGLTPNIPQLS